MKNLSFYEQSGIVLPGALFLFGLLWLTRAAIPMLVPGQFGLGDLGIFIMLSYAVGHAIAAVGNALEAPYWFLFGGKPTAWILRGNGCLLPPEQVERLRRCLSAKFGIRVDSFIGMSKKEWQSIYNQIYRDVLANRAGRLEIFDANYGLNRGLASAAFCLLVIAIFLSRNLDWRVAAALGAMIVIYGFRMHRFGKYFASELYSGFLNSCPRD